MATRADFTTDEWSTILSSPMLAGMAVTLGDPGGIWGTLKEGLASGRALLEVKNAPGSSALMKDLIASIETPEGRMLARDGIKAQLTGKTPPEIKAQALALLERVGKILDAKAPQDAATFKAWLLRVANQVAEASTEGGGFLGFGGVRVSAAENATIADISKALNVS